MNRHVAVLLLVVAVIAVFGITPSTATVDNTQQENNTSLGTSISTFMQVSVAEADSTIDREMWEWAFEHANNASERRELLDKRSKKLSGELSSIQAEREQIKNNDSIRAQVQDAALDSRITEIRISINNVSTTANESDIRSPQFTTLRDEACSASVSSQSSLVNISGKNATGLNCPPKSSGDANRPTGDPGNNTNSAVENTTSAVGNGSQVPPVNATTGNATAPTPPTDPGNATSPPGLGGDADETTQPSTTVDEPTETDVPTDVNTTTDVPGKGNGRGNDTTDTRQWFERVIDLALSPLGSSEKSQ